MVPDIGSRGDLPKLRSLINDSLQKRMERERPTITNVSDHMEQHNEPIQPKLDYSTLNNQRAGLFTSIRLVDQLRVARQTAWNGYGRLED